MDTAGFVHFVMCCYRVKDSSMSCGLTMSFKRFPSNTDMALWPLLQRSNETKGLQTVEGYESVGCTTAFGLPESPNLPLVILQLCKAPAS